MVLWERAFIFLKGDVQLMKKILGVILALALSLSLPVSTLAAVDPTHTQQIRLQGSTRYETAISIADEFARQHDIDFSAGQKFNNIVLASGNNFPDALAGAPLAYQEGAPILLVDSIPEASTVTLDYIEDHVDKNGKVFLLGGTGVIPYSFTQKLVSMGFTAQNIHQLGGKDRNETSLIISKQLQNPLNNIFLVTDSDFADALTVAPTAVGHNIPILLVSDSGLTPDQKAFCDSKDTVVILGQLAFKTNDIYPQAVALAGKDKYETNALWAMQQKNKPFIALTTGEDYPDALAGAVLVGSLGSGPILMTIPNRSLVYEQSVAFNVISYYDKQALMVTYPEGQMVAYPAINYPTLYILGGESAVSEAVQLEAATILDGPGFVQESFR